MAQPDTRTVKDIEEEAVAIITALDASAFEQGMGSDKWHETTIPFSLLDDSHGLAHLLFEVAITDAPNTDDARSTERNNPVGDVDFDVDQTAYIDALMSVAFTYNLRSGTQKADVRKASDAAQQLMRALMGPWDYAANGTLQVLLENPYRPTLDPAQQYVMVDQFYRVVFDMDTSALPVSPS